MAEKRNNGDKRTQAVRIMCLVLVVLMLLGTASTVILFLVASNTSVSAQEYDEPVIAIGITYGSTASSSYRTYSDTGYNITSQKLDGDRTAVVLGSVSEKTLITAPHAGLVPSGTGYAVSSTPTIGGYRLQLSTEYPTYNDAATVVSAVSASASEKGYQVFVTYVSGKYLVRFGCFVDTAAAEAVKADVEAVAGVTVTVVEPSATAVTVLNSSAQILFEYDCGTSEYLSLVPAGTGEVYIRGQNEYIYEGSMLYKRTGNALTVINMVGLEAYIEGVLPYEISPSWHIEAQKAFAVAARSYAMGNLGKHYEAYGFDLCSATNCQVYKGAGSVTDTVRLAVQETAGQILDYNGKPVSVFYSSSTGGCTVSAEDCWGGADSPFLAAVSTPWERYANYNNGSWTVEISPTDLCTALNNKGYWSISNAVASIEVLSYAKNSTYVKSIKFTDTSGNSVTITNSDKIRAALSTYIKSANFVVGKDSVSYTVANVIPLPVSFSILDTTSFNVITALEKIVMGIADSPNVITKSGSSIIIGGAECVITSEDSAGGSFDRYSVNYETKTITAATSGNFVFAGKGWGHGVGLSQYGAKDMAEFGYSYDDILNAYIPAAKLGYVADAMN